MLYAGTGRNAKEFRLGETEVRLWDVTVNGASSIYRGTEQAVMESISGKFYYEDWHIAPRKYLALSSQIVEL